MIRYPHLNLTDWPFRVVPDVSFYAFMADRKRLIQDIRVLLRNLSRRPTSSMHLMLAWFGVGKTHTLHHIEYLCKSELASITPIYVGFPRSTKNFLDVYRLFISKIPIEVINNAYLEVFTSPEKERFQKDLHFDFQDLSNALILLYGGKEQQRQDVKLARTELLKEALRKQQERLEDESRNILKDLEHPPYDFSPLSWYGGDDSVFSKKGAGQEGENSRFAKRGRRSA